MTSHLAERSTLNRSTRHARVATTALATLLTVCANASPANATLPRDGENRAGIAKALAAGVHIEPAAESLMAQAPADTCLNDPLQERCPSVTAIVFAGSSEYVPLPGNSGPVTTMQGYLQCEVRMTPEWPYMSGGRVLAYGENRCTPAASSQEVYTELQKFSPVNSQWVNMDTTVARGAGGYTIGAVASIGCRTSSTRAFRGRVTGYGAVQGVWYAGQEGWFSKSHPCNN